MGITVSSGGRTAAEPNVVPLIDVLLVLIIIFMVMTPKIPTGLPTAIPQPQNHTQTPDARVIVVQVLPDGRLKINHEDADWNRLGPRLFEVFKQRADKIAFVEGGKEVPFASIARAIDVMRGAGIDQVGLITTQ